MLPRTDTSRRCCLNRVNLHQCLCLSRIFHLCDAFRSVDGSSQSVMHWRPTDNYPKQKASHTYVILIQIQFIAQSRQRGPNCLSSAVNKFAIANSAFSAYHCKLAQCSRVNNLTSNLRHSDLLNFRPTVCLFNRGATTSLKLGVQFLGLGYYYPSTEKKFDRFTRFDAVGYIITLFIKKLCEKLGGPSKFWRGLDHRCKKRAEKNIKR